MDKAKLKLLALYIASIINEDAVGMRVYRLEIITD